MSDISEINQKLTIAEAVEVLRREGFDVTPSKLRQYEKQGLLSPEKSLTNHRLYTSSDLKKIRTTLTLLLLGFSIKDIRVFNEIFEMVGKVFFEFPSEESLIALENKKINFEKYGISESEFLKIVNAEDFSTYFSNSGMTEPEIFDVMKTLSIIAYDNLDIDKVERVKLIFHRYIAVHERIMEAIEKRRVIFEAFSNRRNIKYGKKLIEELLKVVNSK